MFEHNRRLAGSELASALRGYLPPSLERRWLAGSEIKNADLCAQHLAALLRTVSTYLPREVTRPLRADDERAANTRQPDQVEGSFAYGTVMFADISGFTAMSETLSQFGKEGAEEIAGIVNRFFAALLEVADRYDGDLLKFGGDALLVYFSGNDHALNACRAALEMQASMSQFSETQTSQGVFRLRMTVGLGSGALFMARLGAREGMEFAVMGPALARMAQAEDRAAVGEIFLDAETRRAAGGRALTEATQDGFHRLAGVPEGGSDSSRVAETQAPVTPVPAGAGLLPWIADTLQRIQALELFLAPGLMEKIKLDPGRIAIGGEYRPVTVLFANFYGIDEIIESLGPAHSAEITAILNAHFTAMAGIIAKYGGVVNKLDSYAVGHRIMALFGAPRAHVDDPERAVRAALEMQEAMAGFARLSTSGGTFSLKQRIGINTGLVFAGSLGSLTRQEYSVMGDEVNLTARLMAVAGDGQILISQSAARQSGDAFLLREREPVRLKGKSLPVTNYAVLGLQERRARERRPLIGRDAEWPAIRSVADTALSGAAQVLTLTGEVGLGKSRLIDELIAYCTGRGSTGLSTACPSFGRHTPYLPWLELLRALFGFNPADTHPVKLDKIDARLHDVDPTWRDWTPLIGQMMGLEARENELIRALDAQSRQRAIARVVTGLVDHVASEGPLLLAIDDLQWADDASVELISQMARQVTSRPLLLALAWRSEEAPALKIADLPHHTSVRLTELSASDSQRLLDALLPTTPQMPDPLQRLILDRARGNPLFIEVVAHSLIENYLTLDAASGAYRARTDLGQIEVPDTINRVIMSRIDRLGESSRNVLKVASAIGQQFEQWLLSAVDPYRHTEEELNQQLGELAQREILDGPHPDLLYLFRHVLTREVAYESLLYADRRQLHRRIGETIEAQYTGRLAEQWEVLAYHFGLAEAWDKALGYHLQAGQRAQRLYANESAVYHFRQALKAAERVPDSEEQQLAAHAGLSEALATRGDYDLALEHKYSALALVIVVSSTPESMARRLADLCRETAAIHEKKSSYATAYNWLRGGLIALEGMEAIEAARIHLLGAGIYHRQGKNNEAIDWCQRSLAAAEKIGGRDGQSVTAHACYLLGLIHNRLGDSLRAVEFCQKSLSLYEDSEDAPGAAQAHINLGNVYFDQGHWSQATAHYLKALDIKRRIGDVYHQAVITLNLGGVYLNQGDLNQASYCYQQSLEMWQALGSTYAIALLHNNMAAVALHRQRFDDAVTLLQNSLELFQNIHSGDFLPEVYRHLAEAQLGLGKLDEALALAQESLARAHAQEMRLEAGATRRVLGQIHLARQDLAQAEQELHTSLHILEEMNSLYETGKSLFQLARLYRARGDSVHMQERLAQAQSIFESLGARLDLARAWELQPG